MPVSSPRKPSVAVVGAGPAGTTLALGLLQHGCEVTLVTDRTAEEFRSGSVMSSQVTFESALEIEAALGIPALLPPSPRIGRMAFDVRYADGATSAFSTPLSAPARSVDLRVKVPALLEAWSSRPAVAASPGCSRSTPRSPRTTNRSGWRR